jgi:hypothetical protein
MKVMYLQYIKESDEKDFNCLKVNEGDRPNIKEIIFSEVDKEASNQRKS